jgi:membrane protein YdbS with pleckstrin-like domain
MKINLGAVGLLVQALFFGIMAWFYMTLSKSSSVNPGIVVFYTLIVFVSIIQVIIYRNDSMETLSSAVFASLGTLILLFSTLYWQIGTDQNFNLPLSRLDGVYFTLGTLTTAGTGNIVATSETARAIQFIQMIVDLGVAALVIGIFVSRISSLQGSSDRRG